MIGTRAPSDGNTHNPGSGSTRTSNLRTSNIITRIIAAAFVAVVAFAVIDRLTRRGPEPAQPQSVDAYVALLKEYGHSPKIGSRPFTAESLNPSSTIVLLDPGSIEEPEADALGNFVNQGGRLVVMGEGVEKVAAAMGIGITHVSTAPGSSRLYSATSGYPETTGIASVESTSGTAFAPATSGSDDLLINGAQVLAVGMDTGAGRMIFLAALNPLSDELLDHADNAAFGLRVVGPQGRAVIMAGTWYQPPPKREPTPNRDEAPAKSEDDRESFNDTDDQDSSYSRAKTGPQGLDSLSSDWQLGVVGLLLAAFVGMWALGRRLGPTEEAQRPLPPPRHRYIRALGHTIARGKKSYVPVGTELQLNARRALVRRYGLQGTDPSPELTEAAARAGLTPEEVRSLTEPIVNEFQMTTAGRAYIKITSKQHH